MEQYTEKEDCCTVILFVIQAESKSLATAIYAFSGTSYRNSLGDLKRLHYNSSKGG